MKKNEYVELFHQMITIRLVEEQASILYQQGKIGGFLHLRYRSDIIRIKSIIQPILSLKNMMNIIIKIT